MAKGAIIARILSEYSDKGTKQAAKDVDKMATKFGEFSKKAARAFGLAALAAGAFAVKVGKDAVQAAMDDQKSQAMLANALRGTVGATDEAIAAAEQYITKLQATYGVADDELRPALSRLAAVTGNMGDAQNLLGIAMDVSAAKGISLEAAAAALSKAYGGNIGALKRMFPQISAATVKSKNFAQAMKEISSETNGAAAAAANTFAGQMQRIKLALGETSESLGYKLLPLVQHFANILITNVIPAIESWVERNGQNVANMFANGISYGIAFGKMLYKVFKFVADNAKVFAVLGAVILAAFVGAKIAAAITIFIGAIRAIITVMKALRTTSLLTAAAVALATGGASAVTGAIAFGGALAAVGLALYGFNKVNKDVDLGKFKFEMPKIATETFKYAKVINKVTGETVKLTQAQLAEARSLILLDKLRRRFGIRPDSKDPITLEAIRLNLIKQAKLGLSSPTISLAASAGAQGSIGSNTSITNGGVTVNVAGSVVSENDLVTAVANGLDTLARRGGIGYQRGGLVAV